MKYRYFIILIIVSVVVPLRANGLMTSTNYTIFADDFNSGVVSTSGTYRMEGTTGESPTGIATSTSYTIQGGYQAMDRSVLALTISDSNLNLGDLNSSVVSTANTTLSVTAESDTGYTLSITSATWASAVIADVSGGTVTAGIEGYGFSITGTDVNNSLLAQDNMVGAVALMSSTTAVSGVSSIITFKATMSGSTAPGTRAQSVVLSLSSNL